MTTTSPLPPHAGRDSTFALLDAPPATHAIATRVLDRGLCGPNDAEAPAYRLFLAVPRAAPPPGGWPILYMLDGNAAFDFLTPAMLEGVPGLIVAGIGYDTEKQFARSQRIRDYSPPAAPGAPLRPDPHHPERLAGGAEVFVARLTGPIRAAAETGLAVDGTRRTLWGHSFGGLCSLYAACTRPGAFARHAVISPSVWWDTPLVEALVAAARFDRHPTRVYMAMGDSEKRTGSAGPPPDGPSPVTMAVFAAMAAKPGVTAATEVYPGAVHIAALPASIPAALALAAA